MVEAYNNYPFDKFHNSFQKAQCASLKYVELDIIRTGSRGNTSNSFESTTTYKKGQIASGGLCVPVCVCVFVCSEWFGCKNLL